MDFVAIEKKWNEKWAKDNIYKFDENRLDKKYYLLEMFSYPSGLNLHLGHWWNFGLSDCFGRFKRLQGYNVFQPMGFDAFGLPAENYALKTGIHPEDSTRKNISVMEKQLRELGGTFNWEYEVITCDPIYYKWTQWIFTKLFEKGLAYQKYAPVNFCPSCNTVLANEQVTDGICERCGSEVERRNMTQWFLKITSYADELLSGLDKLDWPEKTKMLQRNWIGRSVGAEVDFVTDNGVKLTVFTSRVDTIFGVTWLVIAPEHPLVDKITTAEQRKAVEEYVKASAKKDDISRTSTAGEKTGVFTGAYAKNPLTGKRVPVFVGDYVLASYATGIVMGVAAHDERDFEFAKKYNIPVQRVIVGKKGDEPLPFTQYGKLVDSGEFSGMTSAEAKEKIVQKLEKIGAGRGKVNYKLRDWSVSRQRYWGCPIPIVYCDKCGAVAVPEKDLPVILPHISDYKPDGRGPLGKVEEYMSTTCPKCGGKATRDPDTLDTFMCSTWYQLRYPCNKDENHIFDKEKVNKMLPVDKYVGGIEHATSHLLYSRFITKFLRDIGCLDFDEPFKSLVHQGMILGTDGKKMSKRNGGRTADEYIAQYGSDSLKLFMMFGFNYMDGGIWKDDGIEHMQKFLQRVERIVLRYAQDKTAGFANGKAEAELEYVLASTIKGYTESFEAFAFNTAVARLMELVNAMYKYAEEPSRNAALVKKVNESLVILLAPCAPHVAEELWQQIGGEYPVSNQKLPVCDESKLKKQTVEIAVQINSKIVSRIEVDNSLSGDDLVKEAKSDEKVKSVLAGREVVKAIAIAGRLVNLIVKA